MNTVGDVFAGDVLYHGNGLRQYLLKYNRQVDALFENIERSNEATTIDLNVNMCLMVSISKVEATVLPISVISSILTWRKISIKITDGSRISLSSISKNNSALLIPVTENNHRWFILALSCRVMS